MNLSIRQPARLAWLALLLAAGVMLLPASGAQAASKRGAVLVKDIWPGRADSVTEPEFCCGEISYAGGDLTNVGGTLYFSAQDGNGYELWRSDGTRKGTRMVKDINPGLNSSYQPGSSNIDGITAVNRILYFRADDGVHGFELWRSDGTAVGTRMVKDINPAGSSYPGGFINVGGTLYFYGDDGTGRGLWRSDGTEAGTSLVKGFGSLAESSLLTDIGGTLYFALSDEAHTEIWRSDGTSAGTGLVKPGFVGELKFTDFRGTLYFLGDDGIHGPALWRSDGTASGTTMVKDFAPLPQPGNLPCPSDAHVKSCFTDLKHILYFLWSDGANGGIDPNELWRSNGTEAGTSLVKRSNGFFFEPTAVKGSLYLSSRHALWRSDGTRRGTKLVRNFIRRYYRPQSLTAVKTRLYFAAADKRHGEELWRSNGTRKGTRVVWDIRRGEISSSPRNLTAIGSTLFFTAEDKSHGRELWRAGPKPRMKGKPKRKKG